MSKWTAEDIPDQTLSREDALKNAPMADEQYFKVPQVVKNPAMGTGLNEIRS